MVGLMGKSLFSRHLEDTLKPNNRPSGILQYQKFLYESKTVSSLQNSKFQGNKAHLTLGDL
jgi:hypothetical protein